MALLVVRPQAWNPALTAARLSPPLTAAGLKLVVVVPFPNRPSGLYPQQYTTLAVVTPQEKPAPALTDPKLRPPLTATGVVAGRVPGPGPSCPLSLYPQQSAALDVVTPQVSPPALTEVNTSVVPEPATSTGVELLTVVPFPNCPPWLSPQQYTALPVRPQVNLSPAA